MKRTLLHVTPLLFAAGCKGEGLMTINPGLTFWTILTFITVLGILSYVALPTILRAVEERENRLRESLVRTAEDRAEVARLAAIIKEQIEQARADVQGIVADERAQGKSAERAILTEARAEADAIKARGMAEIRANFQREIDDHLEGDAAVLSLQAAARILGRPLDEENSRQVVKELIAGRDSTDVRLA